MRYEVRSHLLSNGMWLYYMSGTANLSGVGIKAGSIHDPAGKSGLAHLTEHVLARRSRKHPDLHKVDTSFLRYLGGPDDEFNIHTLYAHTFYGHNDLFRRRYARDVFDIMASFVNSKTRIIEEEGFGIEVAAVHNEYCLRGVDMMESLLNDSLRKVIYTTNPARNRIDCEVEDLKNSSIEDVRKFAKRYYVPKNAFAVILGPSRADSITMAERSFKDWDVKTEPMFDYDHSDDLPKWDGVKSLEFVRPGISQYHVAIGYPTENYLTEDAEALDMLSNILSFRLAAQLRDGNREFGKGVYRIAAETDRSLVHGTFDINFATVSKEYATYCESVVIREVARLKTELVSKEELKAVVSRAWDAYQDAFINARNRLCEMILEAAANGDPDLKGLNSFRDNLRKLNRRKLSDVANKYFTDSYAKVVIRPPEGAVCFTCGRPNT